MLFFAVPDLLPYSTSSTLPASTQRGWAMLPPIALEFGILSFRGPPTQPKAVRPIPPSRRWSTGCGPARRGNTVSTF